MRAALLALALAATGAAAQEEAPAPEAPAPEAPAAPVFEAPSGLVLSLQDVIWEQETGIVRIRFVADGLGGEEAMAFSEVAGDFAWLCETQGVPALERNGIEASEVIISIADRAVPFGTIDADAVQFFEGYSVTADGTCQWEPF
ncbi:DUF6497 family protein [Wenxinia marina]|uniref:Acetolactate synthase n=1 Tax=Wenxinia marina DSM 24838 TaxID=1123501 RepID=A0A0D0Q8I5_9RHOB|nr:DUF6497 family protein [Wenxinia marina]KIQ68682.1 hypothetical protein Wenmar_02953 [Wenxinia marina DSM 24838]GGL67893.1 hypothetical protein GCM10011392_22960 [Wenxinia marina]